MISYSYDNNGNLLTRTDARSITTTIAYDVLNRPTSKSYNDSPQTPTVNYFYDAQTLPSGAPTFDRGYSTGRLVAVTYGGSSAGDYAGFDALGRTLRKIQQTDSVNYLIEAAYNVSASTSETYPNVPGFSDRRTVTNGFDAAGRLASLTSNATTYAALASVSGISYAAHGALTSATYGNGLVNAATYNSRLQVSEITLTGGSPNSKIDLTYNYGATNNNGNLQSTGYSLGVGGFTQALYTQSFSYDSLNRLSTATETSSGGSTSWSQTNGYDRYGNRWIDLGGGNQSLYFTASTNRITGWSYDASGNLLNDGVHAYTYNAESKISKVDNVSAYVYDGSDQRVKKLVGENTRFVYGIGGQLIAEFDGSTGSLKKEYVYGGGTMATIAPNGRGSTGTQYTTTDALGTPRVVTNSAGAVVGRHDYMPFGEELGAGVGGRTVGMGFGASDGVRQKFTQKERDIETGLDYFIHRYYSSTQGRFVSPDLLFADQWEEDPQSWNLYTYVGNSPLNSTDPFGLWKKVDCDNGGQCWESDRADDTYESLAKLVGSGFVNGKNLAEYFQGQAIELGKVFDTSGAGPWAKNLAIEALTEKSMRYMTIPAGGGLIDVNKARAGLGLLSTIGRWLGFGKEATTLGGEGVAALRQAYESEVRALAEKAAQLKASGSSVEQIAIKLHAERRALGVKYKDVTPPEILQKVLERNLQKYGDELGPSIEWLRKQGKSWQDIIESASRPGGGDLKP